MKISITAALFISAAMTATNLTVAEETHTFKRIQLSDQFWSEGATFGDLNNDGANDVISGPWWWEGPDFKTRHEYYPARTTFKLKLGPMTTVEVPGFEGTLGRENKYSDNFFAWAYDFNKDGWKDILIIGFPGTDTSWFENPKGKEVHWLRHKIFDQTDNESPTFADLTGDGKPELVCITKGQYGYAAPDWGNPAKPWTFHPLSPNNKYGNFTHGLGLGDVNGDGRLDLLEKNGWWEQPASLAGDPVWTFHDQPMGDGGAQMYAYDVNGDGLNDIITALAAHEFGLAWYEQYREGSDIKFREHVFMNKAPADNKYGVKFSEIHAIDLVDMDGDGLKDIVTGKRFWSHGRTGDPDRNDAAVLYWFKLARNADRSVDFVPFLIDNESGVGTQVVAGDINGDGLPDVVVGNKKGTFVHLHEKKIVTVAIALPASSSIRAQAPPPPIRVVLVGDSTVTDDSGWGAGFRRLVSGAVEVVNMAANGRSSKSFIDEGRWTEALAKRGQYYLIQFGHNDEPGKGPERETDPKTTYRSHMARYVDEARAIGAKPVLITSLVRRIYNGDGTIRTTQTPYVEAVRALAIAKQVPLVDLHAITAADAEHAGEEAWAFLSPRDDEGQVDRTHLNAKGSEVVARLLVDALRKAVPDLSVYLTGKP